MSSSLFLRNRQQTRKLDTSYLRRIIRSLFKDILECTHWELGVYLVGGVEMTALNEAYLQHQGTTDVITFDYSDSSQSRQIAGEIFVCIDEAVVQSQRYRTSWSSEVVRYVVHGVLHLRGYDDQTVRARRRMKQEENRVLIKLSHRFDFKRLPGHRIR